jgi:glyoxylase-like metal-dependent hydrolase (beta-lactamase superfamily II)
MLIRILIETTHPLAGTAATEEVGPLRFDGWLEMLRVTSELIAAAPLGDEDAGPDAHAGTDQRGVSPAHAGTRPASMTIPSLARGADMPYRIDRIEGRVMPVNAFVIHGPDGLVVVDGMLTVADAGLVRRAITGAASPLAGVVITHPHPDHYAGLGHLVGDDDVPIVATRAVDEVIRRDDATKNDIVGPMMGLEWPTSRRFPNHLVDDGAQITLGGVRLEVVELGPGESPFDSLWRLEPDTVFAGDLAYSGMHAYLADGHWEEWLATLTRLERELPDDVTLYVGHGPPGGKELLAAQRRYIDQFVAVVTDHADAIAAGDHTPVITAMKTLLPSDDLLFLMDVSIDPTLAALADRGR